MCFLFQKSIEKSPNASILFDVMVSISPIICYKLALLQHFGCAVSLNRHITQYTATCSHYLRSHRACKWYTCMSVDARSRYHRLDHIYLLKANIQRHNATRNASLISISKHQFCRVQRSNFHMNSCCGMWAIRGNMVNE